MVFNRHAQRLKGNPKLAQRSTGNQMAVLRRRRIDAIARLTMPANGLRMGAWLPFNIPLEALETAGKRAYRPLVQ